MGGTFLPFAGLCVNTFVDSRYVETDLMVAKMLKNYVLGHPDAQKRRRVLAGGPASENTLLCVYASRAILESVALLISHGCDVNELSTKYSHRINDSNGVHERILWNETALDAAKDAEADLHDDMRTNLRFSAVDFDLRTGRVISVIKNIEDAGRVSADKEIVVVAS